MSTNPPPQGGTLDGFETRLLSELRQVAAERAATAATPVTDLAAPPAAVRGPAGEPSSRARWARPRPQLILSAGLAVAVAAGGALVATGGGSRAPKVPAVTAAAAILDNAALAALREPAVPARPDQFVYIKMYGVITFKAHHGSPASRTVETNETWTSVSGAREGSQVIAEGNGNSPPGKVRDILLWCQDGLVQPPAEQVGWPNKGHCTPAEFAAFQPGLPVTAAGMLAYLSHTDPRDPHPKVHAENILEEAFTLLTSVDLTPPQEAAVFRALTRVPYLTVVHRVTDALGRTGVGIRSRPANRLTSTAIFDPTTFRLLGANGRTRAGNDLQAVAVAATVVNKIGQRP